MDYSINGLANSGESLSIPSPTFKQNILTRLNALKSGARNIGNMPVKAVVGNPIVDTLLLAGPAIYSKNMENTARMSKEYEPEFWQDWGEYSRREMSNGAEQDDLMPIEDFRKQWVAARGQQDQQTPENQVVTDNTLNGVMYNPFASNNSTAETNLLTPVLPLTPVESSKVTQEASPVKEEKIKVKATPEIKKEVTPQKIIVRPDGTLPAKIEQPHDVTKGVGGSVLGLGNSLDWLSQLLPYLIAGGAGYYLGRK